MDLVPTTARKMRRGTTNTPSMVASRRPIDSNANHEYRPAKARRPRLLEFGGRSRPRSHHARRDEAHQVQGVHRPRESRRTAIRDQERHDGSCRHAQAIRAHQAPQIALILEDSVEWLRGDEAVAA